MSAILNCLYEKVSECFTKIAVNTMDRRERHYQELIERNQLSLKYAGFLPADDFDLTKIHKLEEEEKGNKVKIISRLDKMFYSFQLNEPEEVYYKMNISRTENLSMTEVIKGLKLEDNALMRHVLSTFDLDGNNVFDLSKFKTFYEKILKSENKFAFRVFDVDKNNLVSTEDVICLIEIAYASEMTSPRLSSSLKERAQGKLSTIMSDTGWKRTTFREFFGKYEY